MKQLLFSSSIIALLFFLPACTSSARENKSIPEEVIPVKTLPLRSEEVQQPVSASGRFTTEDETFLSFKTGGIVQQVYVNEGDAVRRGQLLATLQLTEIDAQVQQARFQYERAEREYRRYANLYRDSVATQQQWQQAATDMQIAREQLRSASFNRNYSEIRATGDGYVLKKLANPGQVVGPGTPVLQTNGAGRGGWILKAGISDREWSALKMGDRAVVETDAQPGKQWNAVVLRKSEGI
ncbi:MAG TPA: efflux RND transporter periplasmic adaptor subunit, partial [Chitinophagaceae bacterium]|nr:efflux RND transporter periplasmic adaptor subunit [Chitinophagaceae bacterium]